MSPKNRDWRKLSGWQSQHRSSTALIGPRATLDGETASTAITPKASAPKESWWTKPVQSREEFDRIAAERAREARWVGQSREPTR